MKARLAFLEATIDKLTLISDPATRKAFEAKFQNRVVVVWPDRFSLKSNFTAIVVGFLGNNRLLVLKRDGGFFEVPLDCITPDSAKPWHP